ncbi:MAG: CoA transferase [Chloroflexi bacterium]|nr:CoA transferase [Chloroflexota bacterium]
MTAGAIRNIRVLDFSWGMAGPLTAALLASAGAEVIKIESEQRIDMSRIGADPYTGKPSGINKNAIFNDLNRNKLSANINLKHPKGLELIKRLIRISDVIVENYSAGVMERLGLGYEVVRELNPRIVMSSSSTMGGSGPEVGAIGYAPLFAASSGLSDMTGYRDGPPTEIRYSMDIISGYTTFVAVMAALVSRQDTDQGQYVDFSSRESISILLGDAIMDYNLNGRIQSRNGNDDDVMAPHNCYRCAGNDSWISIAIANDDEWRAFCRAAGDPDWSRDPGFASQESRHEHREELDRLVESWTMKYSHYQAMELLQAAGVAAVASLTPQDLFTDPHLQERGAFILMKHPEGGDRFSVNSPPWRLSETPCTIERDAPLFGEHTEHVCCKLLGLSPEEVRQLTEEGTLK